MFPVLMLRVLISLSFPAEINGAMYLVNAAHTTELQCQRFLPGDQKTVWYQQRDPYQSQLERMNTSENIGSKLRVSNSGIFACCSTTTENCSSYTDIVKFCEHDFFVVAHREEAKRKLEDKRYQCLNHTEELKKPKNTSIFPCCEFETEAKRKQEDDRRHPYLDFTEKLKTEENTNITLHCEFETDSKPFILYWIRSTSQTECLYSFGAESYFLYFNEHCCVDSTQRRVYNQSSLNYSSKCQKHDIEITNTTLSDSGHYFCVVGVWQTKTYNWSIIRNISLQVMDNIKNKGNGNGLGGNWPFYVAFTVIGIITIISGLIVGLVRLTGTKRKGDIVREDFRNTGDPDALDNQECSPYAVGIRNIHDHDPNIFYSTLEKTLAPEDSLAKAPMATAGSFGPEICTVYSEVKM